MLSSDFLSRRVAIAAVVALFALVATPVSDALAQSGATPGSAQGIAIADAPEEDFFACHGANADKTLACARKKCRDTVGSRADCLRVRWCFPAGHSGAMSYLANRSLTEYTFLCGAPSEAALIGMLSAQCAAQESATECRLVAAWSPDGAETERMDLLGKNTAD